MIYFLTKNTLKNNHYYHSFETRPGPRVDPGPEAETGPGWRKNGRRKNPMWPDWPGGLTWQDPVANPLTFVFFCFFFLLKQRHFDLKKKKLTRPTWWPDQNLEPGPWTGPATRPGLKTMTIILSNIFLKTNINVKPPANAWKSSEELEILVFNGVNIHN